MEELFHPDYSNRGRKHGAERGIFAYFHDEANVNAISVLYQLGIATGSNNKYMPRASVTREQAAKIFVNTLDVLGN